MRPATLFLGPVAVAAIAATAGCAAGSDRGQGGASTAASGVASSGSSASGFAAGGAAPNPDGDPETCAEAAAHPTYLGCDFYPTVTANSVWSIFDFAVVVANPGDAPATVLVETGSASIAPPTTIAPGALATIYLPWVPALKGPDSSSCGIVTPLANTVRQSDGAYHLVSSRPVAVYQFNAIEYARRGGPSGKSWEECPGDACQLACYSYSNDASLLLPTTAMTGNYRIVGSAGWKFGNEGSFVAITGVRDDTHVTVSLTGFADVLDGGGLEKSMGGSKVHFDLDQGEVVELVGSPGADFGGSLVQADAPLQVIHGVPCLQVPDEASACDHVEETVLPAETLGAHYVVSVPTGPGGAPVGHVVRIVGNVNGTHLEYPSGPVAGAPSTIDAGEVVDLGIVPDDFEIAGDRPFAVASLQLGASLADPTGTGDGDPAESTAIAVEQWRRRYVFLAPADYDVSFVDVVALGGTSLVLDGAPSDVAAEPVGSSAYAVTRLPLAPGDGGGVHVLEASAPVGIQVIGYGRFTSYQVPGGLDLAPISAPPPPPS